MCEGDEVKFISTQGGKKKKKKNRKNFYAKNICLHTTDEPIRARQLKMTISKGFLRSAMDDSHKMVMP